MSHYEVNVSHLEGEEKVKAISAAVEDYLGPKAKSFLREVQDCVELNDPSNRDRVLRDAARIAGLFGCDGGFTYVWLKSKLGGSDD